MAITNGYTNIAALKLEIANPWTATDTDDDAIEAASRWIDRKCGTRFYTTAADETRYYSLGASDTTTCFLCPDDILSVTNLYTDPDADRTYTYTWGATDYDLMPFGALTNPAGAMPYTWIETTPLSEYTFSTYRRGIKITGRFGYCTLANVPSDIVRACLLAAQRLWKRKDAVFGVAGLADMGQIQLQIPNDPDVIGLLLPYIQRNRGPY